MSDAYRTDLAYIHDAGYGKFAEHAAPVLLRHLQRAGIKSGRVIDLGCGSGILAQRVHAAGFEVVGVDTSPAMIALARKREPGARFTAASFVDLVLPPCVAVAAIGEVLNYCFDPDNSDAAIRRIFRRVFNALCPGGLFLFDIAEPGRAPRGVHQHCRQADDWAVLVEKREDCKRRLLTRTITTFRRIGKQYRRDEDTHVQWLLRRGDLVRWLRAIGFSVQTLRGYGPVRFPLGWTGIAARKPN